MRLLPALTLVLGLGATAALAGPEYTAANGYAASGYDVVAYWSLDQVPVGQSQPAPLAGRADISAEYDGATYLFATEANRDTFLADPAKYAPQYDGHCAYGVAKGGKVPGNPTLWRIVEDKLYFNITKNVVTFWEEDIPGNLTLSEANWTGIEAAPASDRQIPEFTPAAPAQ